ncbi:RNA-binding protein [Bdellovibrionota bacterium FG-1]
MNKKLYVGNLPFGADEAALRAVFESEGHPVASVKVMMDRETGRSRGFAFVELTTPEGAQKALAGMNGFPFQGRPLMINEAREQAPRTGGPRPNGAAGGFSPDRGPRPVGTGGGFNSDRGPRPNGGGFGGGYSPPPPAGIEPPAEGRANKVRDRGREKEKDRGRRNRGNDDW